MKIKIELEIPVERIADLLSCAFESGDVGYWCKVGYYDRTGLAPEKVAALGKCAELGQHSMCVWLPLVEGCSLEVIEHNDSEGPEAWVSHYLTLDKIKEGLKLMAKKNPSQFAAFLNEEEDMVTGDVFLQFCVLGEERYG